MEFWGNTNDECGTICDEQKLFVKASPPAWAACGAHLLCGLASHALLMPAAAGRLIDHARSGRGPGFLEAVTFRWYGHVDWREDIDVGVNRSADQLDNWRKRDPIARLAAALTATRQMSGQDLIDMETEIASEVEAAWMQAQADPYPQPEALLSRVFAHQEAAR